MVCDKVRIRFSKAGDLRLVSHHDLMRCWERMLRRAAIPFHSTSGFNPKPRLVFALSLGLGIVGAQEVVELELDAELPLEELHEKLRQQTPPGLTILDIRRIPTRTTAQVRRVGYRVPIPSEPADSLRLRAAELLAAPDVWIERHRPERRRLNIRPYLDSFRILSAALEMDLWVTPTGTARPDEILALLGLEDCLSQGTVLERIFVELQDEVPASAPAPSPANERMREPPLPNETPTSEVPTAPGPTHQDQRPHPLLPGPLDY